MESPAPVVRSEPSKAESLKLKISTNHADGTSKIVTNRGATAGSGKSNHSGSSSSSSKDSSQRVATNKDGVGGSGSGGGGGGSGGHRDGSKHKHEHKSKESSSSSSSKDPQRSSSSDKHKSSSSSSSNKVNSSSSSSKDGRPKDASLSSSSSSSKHKDSKPTTNGDRPKDIKSSSSGDKPKSSSSSNHHSSSHKSSSSSSSSSKPKDGSSSKSSSSKDGHHKSSSGSSSSSKPREGGSGSGSVGGSGEKKSSSSSSSSSKPREGSTGTTTNTSVSNSVGSPPPSVKPKSSSSGSGDHHKSSSSSSSSSRPKDGTSSSSNKDGAPKTHSSSSSSVNKSSSRPADGSSRPADKKPSSSSSSSTPKVKDEKSREDEKSRNKENHESSHKDKPKDGSSSSSSKPKDKPKESRDDKVKTEVKIKQEPKDKESGSGSKSKSNSTSTSSSSNKVKSEPNGRVSSHESKTVKVKHEQQPFSDEDTALADKKLNSSPVVVKKEIKTEKRPALDEDSEDEPLMVKLGKKAKTDDKRGPAQKKRKSYAESSSEDEPVSKKLKKDAKKKVVAKGGAKMVAAQPTASPAKRKKAGAEEPEEVWKWWEEEKKTDGSKWKTLEHKGPIFAPDYDPLPSKVKFFYNGKHVELSKDAEEVATFYAKMLEHDYTSKDAFNKNFMKDWRKSMTDGERELITDLKKCDFKQMHAFFTKQSEDRKNRTKEEKKQLKDENEALQKEYGFCIIDGHKEKIGNFKIEPPGLFRGRGEHPKMGRLKTRTQPEDVIINCSKGSKVPDPPAGHKWKEVRHDNAVSWLASWQENVQGQIKYVMLNPSSKLKGQKDMEKYELARRLKTKVSKIREEYRQDWRSKEMRLRQRAVALYFIDQLALRAGNEKDSDETADTVGCCSLRVEHIKLHDKKDKKENVVEFDFLGKDSIRYFNSVSVEKRVYKNVQLFMQGKQPQDDLFDRLNTSTLNKYLNDLMEGLTAKVFRTFNASKTLQEQLDALTKPKDSVAAKILSYNRANRAVAILCNHQRAVPKTFDKSMENMQAKIKAKEDQIDEAKRDLKSAKGNRSLHEKKEKALERLKEQLDKLELSATDKEENKQIALGTSKLNYLDPRISVAWCKKWEIPIEKIYNKTQRDKFRWAIEMAGPDFEF